MHVDKVESETGCDHRPGGDNTERSLRVCETLLRRICDTGLRQGQNNTVRQRRLTPIALERSEAVPPARRWYFDGHLMYDIKILPKDGRGQPHREYFFWALSVPLGPPPLLLDPTRPYARTQSTFGHAQHTLMGAGESGMPWAGSPSPSAGGRGEGRVHITKEYDVRVW